MDARNLESKQYLGDVSSHEQTLSNIYKNELRIKTLGIKLRRIITRIDKNHPPQDEAKFDNEIKLRLHLDKEAALKHLDKLLNNVQSLVEKEKFLIKENLDLSSMQVKEIALNKDLMAAKDKEIALLTEEVKQLTDDASVLIKMIEIDESTLIQENLYLSSMKMEQIALTSELKSRMAAKDKKIALFTEEVKQLADDANMQIKMNFSGSQLA